MSKVAVVKGDAYSATVKALKLTNFNQLIKRKTRIVIKPNLTVPITADKGITTDVNVIRAIIDQIPNPEKIKIVEGSIGDDTTEAFKINGYYKLEEDYGLKIIDTHKDKYEEVKVKKPLILKKIKISKTIFESDFLISVAKLKIHSIAVITGTLKNMMGACPKEQKSLIHCYIPNSLADLISVKKPDFGVIDGVVANEIDEIVPHPIKMGIVLASSSCVALDFVASQIMGIEPKNVPHLQKIINVLGDEEIEVLGEKIEDVKRNFKRKPFNIRSDGQRIVARALLSVGLFDYFSKNVFPKIRKIREKINL
jgi:uncharacterized protein (DUF362 family)